MKKKLIISLGVVLVLTIAITSISLAVSGAGFTTFNPSVDGYNKTVCKNSIINCNIYGAKEYVWLNGGPTANGLGPDGEYFFAVLEPGGQPNPNDQGGVPDKNLSDDYDLYTNRTFTVTDGEVSAYTGDHWLDSNTQAPLGCKNGNGPFACDGPDGLPPYIRLFPYSDTTNPGGVYIMAICSLEDGYPVRPRDCKYDAFKVKEGRVSFSFMLDGYKFHDLNADGLWGIGEEGLPGWTITIFGTGYLGEVIDEAILTGEGGFWEYTSPLYTFVGQDKPVAAELTICEVIEAGYVQSFPPGGCYEVVIDPSGVGMVSGLNFGNYIPVDITVCKETDDYDPLTPPMPFAGWEVYLYRDGELFDTQLTGEDGCYTWVGLMPGYEYAVGEYDPLMWVPIEGPFFDFGLVLSGDGPFSHTFVNVPAQGCTPGFWQGGPDKPDAKAGGSLLWDGDDEMPWDYADALPPPHVDAQWTLSGGMNGNPYIHITDFNTFFGGGAPGDFIMFELVDTGGGSENWRKAARSLVAGYLNASYGMNYAYTTGELQAMWTAAAGDDAALMELHTLLDAANNHFDIPEGECPISASGW
jgi:hypothetical protein